MIDRYTRKEMGFIWSSENRFEQMKNIELAVAQAQAEQGIIPKEAVDQIVKKAKFDQKRIAEIEEVTKHDVIAFVSNLAENVGEHGKFIHYGLTSSDVLDSAVSLQFKQSTDVLLPGLIQIEECLADLALKHVYSFCAGRTHGMHAELTSFGVKMAGFLAEAKRNRKRLFESLKQVQKLKLSGAVGTYSTQSEAVEQLVGERLGLMCELVATQVIPRDRHAQLINSLALYGCCIERLAVELRHLQRTEVSEVFEGFTKGQKGSSAMPHKKNPISSENLSGVARLLRGYALSAMENVALWHERDISHSSVERVIFPDALIVFDYALSRMVSVLKNLQVKTDRMMKNIDLSSGQLFSSQVLLCLVKKGLSREEAYQNIQRVSHSLNEGENLKDKLLQDEFCKNHLDEEELKFIFSGDLYKSLFKRVVDKSIKSQDGDE